MTDKKSVLVLPSWYATPEAPTSGSFFREQTLLMEDLSIGNFHWDMEVITTEKEWISKRRHLYYRLLPSKIPAVAKEQHCHPPEGKVIHYPFCKYISDAENLQQETEEIIRYLKTKNRLPDIIHAHSTLKGGILAYHIAKVLNIPYIITEHMNPFLLHKYTDFWKTEIGASLENANAVLVVSEHQRQQLLLHQINCNPVVVGNLVDDGRFIPVPPIDKAETHYLIITYYPNFIKDMDTLFDMLVLLKEENQLEKKQFTIVGGGEKQGTYEKNYYQQRISSLELTPWVKVVPSANRDEIARLIQQTDALISTSIAETFGVAICEAMLCGKPAITTLNGGINDYVSPDNSITVPIRNPAALKNAVLQFEKEKNRFDPKKIRDSIARKYGQKAFRQTMENIYAKLLPIT